MFVPASGRSKAGMFSSMGELGEDLKRDGAPFVCMNGLTVSNRTYTGGDLSFTAPGIDLVVCVVLGTSAPDGTPGHFLFCLLV